MLKARNLVFEIVALFVLTFLSGTLMYGQKCDPSKCAHSNSKSSNRMGGMSESANGGMDAVQTLDVTFSQGKLIEVGLYSIKDGMEAQVKEDYFPKVMPIAMEYGLKPIASFSVEERVYGGSPAQAIGFFEWPSLEAKRNFDADPRYLELRNIRNEALDFLTLGYFEAEETQNVTFRSDRTYDFAAMWLDPNNQEKLGEYFEKVAPVAEEEYGFVPHLVSLKPLEAHDKTYHPHMVGMSEWPTEESLSNFFENEKVYQKNVHLRDEAVAYMDVFLLKPVIK